MTTLQLYDPAMCCFSSRRSAERGATTLSERGSKSLRLPRIGSAAAGSTRGTCRFRSRLEHGRWRVGNSMHPRCSSVSSSVRAAMPLMQSCLLRQFQRHYLFSLRWVRSQSRCSKSRIKAIFPLNNHSLCHGRHRRGSGFASPTEKSEIFLLRSGGTTFVSVVAPWLDYLSSHEA